MLLKKEIKITKWNLPFTAFKTFLLRFQENETQVFQQKLKEKISKKAKRYGKNIQNHLFMEGEEKILRTGGSIRGVLDY